MRQLIVCTCTYLCVVSCRRKVLSSVKVNIWMKQGQMEMKRYCKCHWLTMLFLLFKYQYHICTCCVLVVCFLQSSSNSSSCPAFTPQGSNQLHRVSLQEHPLLRESAGILQDVGWENWKGKEWRAIKGTSLFDLVFFPQNSSAKWHNGS